MFLKKFMGNSPFIHLADGALCPGIFVCGQWPKNSGVIALPVHRPVMPNQTSLSGDASAAG